MGKTSVHSSAAIGIRDMKQSNDRRERLVMQALPLDL